MDVLYERNVTASLTTIISNVITSMLLGVSSDVRYSIFDMDAALKEKGIASPTWRVYLQALMRLVYHPNAVIDDAVEALVDLIKGICKGMPYKYTRLLSAAEYFIGYDSEEEFNQDNSGNRNKTTQRDEDNNDSVNFCNYKYRVYPVDDTEIPKVWLPKYWPKKMMGGSFQTYAPPDEAYISDFTFDGMYSLKSSTSCLFGAVQCISTIVSSCMRLRNMDTVHTMDVLSIYTSYMLLCVVIFVSFLPAYHCKPVVCIPVTQLKKYQRIPRELPHPNLRFRIYQHFENYSGWGSRLIRILLLIPICLMVVLLIYINKNDTLLLSLNAVWVFATVLGDHSRRLLIKLFPCLFRYVEILQCSLPIITGSVLVALVVCSCLNATVEQKYPSSVNWLPHF